MVTWYIHGRYYHRPSRTSENNNTILGISPSRFSQRSKPTWAPISWCMGKTWRYYVHYVFYFLYTYSIYRWLSYPGGPGLRNILTTYFLHLGGIHILQHIPPLLSETRSGLTIVWLSDHIKEDPLSQPLSSLTTIAITHISPYTPIRTALSSTQLLIILTYTKYKQRSWLNRTRVK